MSKKITPFIVMAGILLSGCSSRTLDDVVEEEAMQAGVVTYMDVAFVFSNNCVTCHGNPTQNGAPMSLTSYEFVKEAIETRGLLDRITRDEGAPGFMPLGGPRLSQQQIDLVMQWNADGLLEN